MKKILSILILLFSLALSQIDMEESYISYMGTHPLHSWEGISRDISFNMKCTGDHCLLDVSAPLESFDSGNDGRDNNMLYYTESLQYPEVRFKTESFKFTGNFDTSIDVKGELTFHGITKEIPVKIVLYKELDLDGSTITHWGKCSFNISLDSFNVSKPNLLLVKISDEITVNVKLKLLNK
jgi:polyisoprenoid-binding protein YceI